MGLFDRIKKGLSKTRKEFSSALEEIFLEEKGVDEEALERLEALLVRSDMGIRTAELLLSSLKFRIHRKELKDPAGLKEAVREELLKICSAAKTPESFPFRGEAPHVIMVIGVNGAGKTTTIGKLAFRLKQEKKSVLLAAGDTFRAAAAEQLILWGKRNGVEIVSQQPGADPSAVAFDAYARAKAKGIEVLIVDTAGRLHTKSNLMDELKKIRRTLGKVDPTSPHEVLLVLDATQGQNALNQARMFNQAIGVSGIVLTKLDSSSKGGIVIPVMSEVGIPVVWVGIGEKEDDLERFDAKSFVDALFSD